jgi:hypothetical protein
MPDKKRGGRQGKGADVSMRIPVADFNGCGMRPATVRLLLKGCAPGRNVGRAMERWRDQTQIVRHLDAW